MKDKLKFAKMIVAYSCKIQPGETVYINFKGTSEVILNLIVEEIYRVGGKAIINKITPTQLHKLIRGITPGDCVEMLKKDLNNLDKCSVYISLLEDSDIMDNSSAYYEKMSIYTQFYATPFRNERLQNCRWIGLRLPSKKLASKFNMSLEEFEEFYYQVCGLDYLKLKEENQGLRDELAKAEYVRLVSEDTNFEFEKKGIDAVTLAGEKNLPDGEIYTSPTKTSPTGKIKFNTKSIQGNYEFSDIELEFAEGQVINFNSNNNKLLEKILDTDAGSKYIGEFALGINPGITKPSGIILYDEKISGSIHLALGQSYKDAYNGNDSSLHWDLVKLLTPEYGGGKLYLDDKLIIDNGQIIRRR